MHGNNGVRKLIRAHTDRHERAGRVYALRRIQIALENRIAEAQLIGWKALEQSFEEDMQYVKAALRRVEAK